MIDTDYDDYQFKRRALVPPSRRAARTRQVGAVAAVLLLFGLIVLGAYALLDRGSSERGFTDQEAPAAGADVPAGEGEVEAPPSTAPGDPLQAPVAPRPGELVNPASSGHMWSVDVPGSLTFRGNPTRTYYGHGPVPKAPGIDWYYPRDGGMCSSSTAKGETKTWCGMGWTGQPAVFERDGRTWVVFGAYDRAVHFMDAETGEDILPPFPTGDIIKGSVTMDPDGYPILYTGSRDSYFRAIALDRPGGAVELWKLSAAAVSPTLWNNDWDGSALVLDDYLLEGGENSQFHMVKLNRAYDSAGLVTIDPKLVFNAPSWDQQVIADLAGNRSKEMSVEGSVAVSGNTVYFANSGGLVSGWDLGPLVAGTGQPVRTLRFWTGDDTDASIAIDADGYLYVSVEYERGNARAAEVGQLMKLDPRRPDDPVVWSYQDRVASTAGFWGTAALHRDVVINATNGGKLLALDKESGKERWSIELSGPTWQSPVIVDDVLVYGDCRGTLRGYDVSDTSKAPPQLWQIDLGGCIEATPSVWKGRIYLGTRAGRFFALSDDGTSSSPTASAEGGGGE